jgi:hypothetical protein
MNKVTIAGCGAAGCFLALRALQLGLDPTLLRAPIPAVGGIEIIPASAGRLLEALGLDELLAGLGAGLSDSLTRRRADGTLDTARGRSLHVDRLKLRDSLIAEAERRGARIRDMVRIPPPDPMGYSVDATGQRAVWSRPVIRRGRHSADIFTAEAAVAPGTGRLAFLGRRWAYLASDQNSATVGVIGRHAGGSAVLDAETREALGLALEAPFRLIGRRPAFVQWAEKPVLGLRFSIGDAAFHHDPIGGRGLAFALGSSFAVAAALVTRRDDPGAENVARAYYEGYVASEASRHLAFLDGEVASPPAPAEVPRRLRWIAPVVSGALALNARIVAGEMFTLASGRQARWAGGLDLARLRELTLEAQPSTWVAERLRAEGLDAAEARSVLMWALAQGLVEAAEPSDEGAEPGRSQIR